MRNNENITNKGFKVPIENEIKSLSRFRGGLVIGVTTRLHNNEVAAAAAHSAGGYADCVLYSVLAN